MESKQSRVTIFVVAIALLVALFFAFRSGDDDSETTTTTTTPATQTTEATTTDGATAQKAEQPKPKIPEIVVAGGEPKGGVAELDYEKGDRIRFRVRSDVAEEIHVHGYDVTAEVPAGGKAELSFAADLEGIFEVELHGSGALIAELTVEP